jgi:hypothetical protein
MAGKTAQLQIRVTPQQKAALKRRAAALGLDVSGYVLSRLVPPLSERFAAILRALESDDGDDRYALAELNDLLHRLSALEFAESVSVAPSRVMSPYLRNYVAAMVEQAAFQKDVAPPSWVRDIAPLVEPRFATPLRGLRTHLLVSAPVPFKRRNIFVDSGVGARV